MKKLVLLAAIAAIGMVACTKSETTLNNQPVQNAPTADPIEQPYTYLQNKYIDLALSYEFKKIGESIELEKMELQEKLDLIFDLYEKNVENTSETKEDILFYNALENQLMSEINRHPYLQKFITQFALREFYDENDMIIVTGYDDTDAIAKFHILFCYEVGFDVYEKYLEREEQNYEEWELYLPLPPYPSGIEMEFEKDGTYQMPSIQRLVRYTGYAKWPKSSKYRLDDAITTATHNTLKDFGMQSWKDATNSKLAFSDIPNNSTNKFGWSIGCLYHIYVTTTNDNVGGYALIGYRPWSKMQLNQKSGVGYRTVRHEMGHIIGLQHEHQRPDRDTYINIHWNNIDPNYKYAFDKVSSSINKTYGDFDFNSVMIYGSQAFLKSGAAAGSNTMTRKDGSTWGSPSDLSSIDKEKIKLIYK